MQPNSSRGGISIKGLVDGITTATDNVNKKLDVIRSQGSNISIADMFDMQMLMNRLAQLSETSSSVVSAAHSAISSMARNVKS